ICIRDRTGATSNRRKVVDRFNNDPSCKVFLMTLKTGGVGLNLTVADTVFIFEPWWNKAAEEQAINRLHRIGQKAKVHSYSIIAIGTIEEKIRELQEQKALLFEGLISSDSSSSKFLSEEDINFIFGR
ncbi:MAG: SWF/SNF helicase family protein, partial [Duncaniella sp.]|nr:SWF/SNF helicase family protein [Duncaniella sp.]